MSEQKDEVEENKENTETNNNVEENSDNLKNLLQQLNQKNLPTSEVEKLIEKAKQFENVEGYKDFMAFAEAKKQNKELTYDDFQQSQHDDTKSKEQARDTISVENGEKDWMGEKRKFWEEFAKEQGVTFTNVPEDDMATKSFTGTLLKDNQEIGKIKYTTPSSATISKDSSLVLYKGLVKDAIKSGLSITFGKSLDEKQQAMLLAACLQNQDKYDNGGKLEMKNLPKIDVNADYFKELPKDVQDTLIPFAKIQELKEKIAEKTAENKGKGEKGKPVEISDEVHNLNDEINALTVSSGRNRDGTFKSEQALTAEKNAFQNNKINKEKNPALYAALQQKYSGQQH